MTQPSLSHTQPSSSGPILPRLADKLRLSPDQRQWLGRHWKILDNSWLKIIALLLMTIDHTAAFLLIHHPAFITPLFFIGSHPVRIYTLMRMLGRLAFPLFAFMLVEGFEHTHNRFNYGRNLFLFALISELPWNLAHSGTLLFPLQNIFFTLFLGYLGICALHYLGSRRLFQLVVLLGLLILSIVLRVDYGCAGFGIILLFYLLRSHPTPRAIVGCCLLPSRWVAGLAFIPISMYNGKRGFIKGPVGKYLCYLYYPLHLFVFYLLLR